MTPSTPAAPHRLSGQRMPESFGTFPPSSPTWPPATVGTRLPFRRCGQRAFHFEAFPHLQQHADKLAVIP